MRSAAICLFQASAVAELSEANSSMTIFAQMSRVDRSVILDRRKCAPKRSAAGVTKNAVLTDSGGRAVAP
jgi:hypothetical protein